MWPQPSSKTLAILLVVGLICVLMVSGPAHAALHSDSPGDGCSACHVATLELVTPVPVRAWIEAGEAAPLPPLELPRAAALAPSTPPRAPPRA